MGLPPQLPGTHTMIQEKLTQGAAQHNQESGPSLGHNPRPSDWQCPSCPTDVESRLYSYPGKFGLICQLNPDHQFHDMAELIEMNPKKLPPLQKQKKAIQTGETKIELIVETRVLSALQERFGERLAPSLAAVFRALTDANSFVMNTETVRSVSSHLGRPDNPVKDGFDLAGAVWDLRKDRDELRVENSNLREQLKGKGIAVPTGQDSVVVYLKPEIMEQIKDKAKFNNQPPDLYLSGIIRFAAENGWL